MKNSRIVQYTNKIRCAFIHSVTVLRVKELYMIRTLRAYVYIKPLFLHTY